MHQFKPLRIKHASVQTTNTSKHKLHTAKDQYPTKHKPKTPSQIQSTSPLIKDILHQDRALHTQTPGQAQAVMSLKNWLSG